MQEKEAVSGEVGAPKNGPIEMIETGKGTESNMKYSRVPGLQRNRAKDGVTEKAD